MQGRARESEHSEQSPRAGAAISWSHCPGLHVVDLQSRRREREPGTLTQSGPAVPAGSARTGRPTSPSRQYRWQSSESFGVHGQTRILRIRYSHSPA